MTKFDKKYYFRSIDRRWKAEISDGDEKVIILSPYITPNTAQKVLIDATPSNCDIYTSVAIMNFVSGASSIDTLKYLKNRGFGLYSLKNIHAKIILIPNRFCSIGSQNLTYGGTKNKEATLVVTDPIEVEQIHAKVKNWKECSMEITDSQIQEISKRIPILKKKYEELQKFTQISDNEITTKAVSERVAIKTELIPKKAFKFLKKKSITKEEAMMFISRSAWWYGHPSHPVRAHKHQYRTSGNNPNWMIEFGANTFLVGRAIARCKSEILSIIKEGKSGKLFTMETIKKRLYKRISNSVANSSGNEYNGGYPWYGKHMIFGTQSINLSDFVDTFFEFAPVDKIFK